MSTDPASSKAAIGKEPSTAEGSLLSPQNVTYSVSALIDEHQSSGLCSETYFATA